MELMSTKKIYENIMYYILVLLYWGNINFLTYFTHIHDMFLFLDKNVKIQYCQISQEMRIIYFFKSLKLSLIGNFQ